LLDVPRALLTALYRAAVEGAAPFPRTRDALAAWLADHRDGLPRDARFHCIALGKAAPAMFGGAARALDDAGLEIAGGAVVCANHPAGDVGGEGITIPATVSVSVGDHPVPGPASLDAGDAIDDAVRQVDGGDVVIVLLSGGTTALAAAPVPALSQALGDAERAQNHIANLAETLLESGLAIHEMNAIRRRVLRWGAGRLAVALHARGAIAIPVFAISDVIGDDPATIGSGPCSPDPLDAASFLALVDAHAVRGSLERAMGEFLGILGAGAVPSVPPPEHPAFACVHYQLVARNADAVAALAAAARAAGIEEIMVEQQPLAGDAAGLGDALARRALAAMRDLPRRSRALYIAGGEPVVHLRATFERAWADGEADDDAIAADPVGGAIDFGNGEVIPLQSVNDEPMRGGRMQVLALTAALALEEAAAHGVRDVWRITVLAAGTDGRDGPTDAAGAIVDAGVPSLARRAGRNPERDVATGRSNYPLDTAGALLKHGPTGTNVMDVVAIFIDAAR
jgi:glycerate 2-kinase